MDKIIKNISESNFLTKKNIISFLLVGILFLAIPVGVQLVQKQQSLKSKAAADPVTFVGPNGSCNQSTSECVVTKRDFEVQLSSPYGPPVGTTSNP